MSVEDALRAKYGEAVPFDLPLSFEDASNATPIFFLLSPGVAVPMETLLALGKPLDAICCSQRAWRVCGGRGVHSNM